MRGLRRSAVGTTPSTSQRQLALWANREANGIIWGLSNRGRNCAHASMASGRAMFAFALHRNFDSSCPWTLPPADAAYGCAVWDALTMHPQAERIRWGLFLGYAVIVSRVDERPDMSDYDRFLGHDDFERACRTAFARSVSQKRLYEPRLDSRAGMVVNPVVIAS